MTRPDPYSSRRITDRFYGSVVVLAVVWGLVLLLCALVFLIPRLLGADEDAVGVAQGTEDEAHHRDQ
jgi:hypothetical protein